MLLTNSQMDKLAAARQEFRKLGMMDGTTAGYTAMILGGGKPQPRDLAPESDDDKDDDNGPEILGTSINSTVNCELVKLVTTFHLADNRKSGQNGQKSEKIFVVLLMKPVEYRYTPHNPIIQIKF